MYKYDTGSIRNVTPIIPYENQIKDSFCNMRVSLEPNMYMFNKHNNRTYISLNDCFHEPGKLVHQRERRSLIN